MEDVLVVGGGPAGLTAALYLARYRRRVRVIHDLRSRALLAPLAHNVPGFPGGIAGAELIARMTEHAERYGATIEKGRVTRLSAREQGGYDAMLDTGETVSARGAILATGVDTRTVTLDEGDHDAAVRAGVLRYCPICDGYEQQGAAIAVLGSDLHGAAEAMFLRQYSDAVTLIPKERVALTAQQRADLSASKVAVLERKIVAIGHAGQSIALTLDGETVPRRYDILYPALGSRPRTELAEQLGIAPDAEGGLVASAFGEALRPGLFAAGDVLTGLDQISVATGQGAMAATRLHNWLREQEHHVMTEDTPVANGARPRR